MGRVVTVLSAVAFVVLCFTCKADTKKKHSIAVTSIQTEGVAFPDEFLESLEQDLIFRIEKSGWPGVLPPSRLKRRCATQSCQLEEATNAGADLVLITRIQKRRGLCSVTAYLYDPKSGSEDEVNATISDCKRDIVSSSFKGLAEGLARYKPFREETKKMKSKAFALTKEKRYREAIIIFREVLEIDPKNCGAIFGLANVYAKMGIKAESSVYMRIFIESCPLNIREAGDYPTPKEFKKPGDYFIDYQHIRG